MDIFKNHSVGISPMPWLYGDSWNVLRNNVEGEGARRNIAKTWEHPSV